MARAIQKLTRHGNATGVNIPRAILIHLGWLPGQGIVIELTEDKSLILRRPNERDYAPLRAPRIEYEQPELVAK
jgi:antitoxin component of MazEF toxin-antitoxin module